MSNETASIPPSETENRGWEATVDNLIKDYEKEPVGRQILALEVDLQDTRAELNTLAIFSQLPILKDTERAEILEKTIEDPLGEYEKLRDMITAVESQLTVLSGRDEEAYRTINRTLQDLANVPEYDKMLGTTAFTLPAHVLQRLKDGLRDTPERNN